MGAHLATVAVAVVLVVLAAAVVSYSLDVRDRRDEAREEAMFRAELAADAYDESIATASTTVSGLIAQPGLAAALRDPAACGLDIEGFGVFVESHLDLMRTDGRIMCSSLSPTAAPEGASHADAPWLEQLPGVGLVTTLPFTDGPTGKPSVAVAAPIVSDGSIIGAVVAVLHLDSVADGVTALYASEDLAFAVADPATGAIVRAPDDSDVETTPPTFPAGEEDGTWSGTDGDERIHGSAPLGETGLRVYAGVDSSAVTAGARTALARSAGFAAAVIALLLVALWMLNRRIVRPIRDVTAAVIRAGRHPESESVAVTGPSEVAALADEFNAMLRARTEHEAQLVHQALSDGLTGLPNRTLVLDRLEQAIARWDRADGLVAVLVLDLDRFKVINDSLGTSAGDHVLLNVAARLRRVLRPEDTLGRLSGDEFAVVREGSDRAELEQLAARLSGCFDEPFDVDGTTARLTVTIGIALASATSTAGGLLRDAVTAVHAAKADGRGLTEVFDDELRRKAIDRFEIENDLRMALDGGGLDLHYQPVFDLANGRPVSVEALLRWTHPVRGAVPPGEFIPVAEESGLISPIGALVLMQSCWQAASWASVGRPIRVSVNVSGRQLAHGGFGELVRRALRAADLPPDQLTLELTESLLVQASPEVRGSLEQLREAGVGLAIDDFGTGYSSLTYLRQFHVDELKIDQTFVHDLSHQRHSDHLVAAMIAMANALDIVVVAEGVEDAEQLDQLRRLGCDRAQGFLLARPAESRSVEALLRKASVVV